MEQTPGSDQEPEWLEAAPTPLTPAQRTLRRRLLGAVSLVVVGVLVTSILVQRHDREASRPPAPATPTASSTPTLSAQHVPTAPSTGSDPVVVRRSSSVLGDVGDVDVFVLGPASVSRIEASSGRVTKTAVDLGADPERASFLAVPGGVIVRPEDSVPGVLVRDNHAAQPLRGLLRQANVVLPGPDGHVWAASYEANTPARLTDLRGRSLGPTSPSPIGWALSDQAGHLLVSDVGGTYESRPSGLRRVTTGQVTAAGPHHYVLVECDDIHRCSSIVVDRATGEKRRLGPASTGNAATGAVSPDGRHAILSQWSPEGNPRILLQDLRTGRTRSLGSSVGPSFVGTTGIAAWTPDSRHLLLVAGGVLTVVDPTTARITPVDVGLGRVLAVSVRSTS